MMADKKQVTRLLKTARGQIDGILKMVEEDRYCIDISHQIMASEAILKRANKEGYIIDTPNRSELWITQTPQSFKTDLVKMAYKKMKEELEKGNATLNITDDAMVVEEFTTNQVRFVQGDYKNIKVTTPEDIDIAELFIELDAK